MNPQPQGKPIRELREIVKGELRRWDILGDLWGELTADEQLALIDKARELTRESKIADAFTPPDPFSRKA